MVYEFSPSLSQEEYQVLREYEEDMKQRETRRAAKNERVLKIVESLMGTRFEAVQEDFKDCNIWKASLTKEPPAKRYLEDKDLRRYIEQHGSEDFGGYHGRIWYHLKGKHWLVMEYTC